MTSTTAVGFLVVVTGYVGVCLYRGDIENLWRLVQMYVPGYLTVKGFQMGKNGTATPTITTPEEGKP